MNNNLKEEYDVDITTIADIAVALKERGNPVLNIAIIDYGWQVSLSLGHMKITVGAAFLDEALWEAFREWDLPSSMKPTFHDN